jgi:hypothetical protein
VPAQVVVVNCQGAQSAGLISGPIVVPINTGVGLALNDILSDISILQPSASEAVARTPLGGLATLRWACREHNWSASST